MPRRQAPLAKQLGRRIADLRAEHGLTQEKLAWEAGLKSKGYLSRIESGQRLPSLSVLEQLADRLSVEVRDFFIFPDRDIVDAAMDILRADRGEAARVLRRTKPRRS